jgi:phosphonate transport system substrate-binding protein
LIQRDFPALSRPGRRLAALGLCLWALMGQSAGTSAPSETLILGVHPYLSYSQLKTQFDPLAHYLSAQLGIGITVRIGNSYADHVEETGLGRIGLAYMGPVGYVQLTEKYGPRPLLAMLETGGTSELNGHIVVRQDSALRDLDDLANRTIGLGDPGSTMSSVVPTALLRRAGVEVNARSAQRRYRGHNSIAIAVLSGQVDAGAVKDEVYRRHAPAGLRSLVSLPSVSEHLFVASPALDPQLVARIRELLLGLHQTREGRLALRAIHPRGTALVPVSDADYESLRALLFPAD